MGPALSVQEPGRRKHVIRKASFEFSQEKYIRDVSRSDMNRRTFLASSATVVWIPLVGCTRSDPDDQAGVILTHVELGNASGDSQIFDLLVTHDDDIVHWSLHEVPPGSEGQAAGGRVVDIDGPDEPGRVEVHVRVGSEWRSIDFTTDKYDGRRVIAVVTYGMIEDDLLRISRRISDRPLTTAA